MNRFTILGYAFRTFFDRVPHRTIRRCATLKEALRKARGRERVNLKRQKSQHTALHMHERSVAMDRETKAKDNPERLVHFHFNTIIQTETVSVYEAFTD